MFAAGRRRGHVDLMAIVAAVLLLTAASHVQLPIRPVPLTLQTLAVALVGAALGWRAGLCAILLWLLLAALGLPVLAGGTGGPARFAGPTAGYLAAFPIAGVLVGRRVEQGKAITPADAFFTMLLAHAICLGLGAAWLSTHIGMERAIRQGLPPLLPGALVKSAIGAAIIPWLPRRGARR